MQLILVLAAAAVSVMAQPPPPTHYGCWKEMSGGHAINDAFIADFATGTPPTPGMTVPDCETHCTGLSYDLWALQNSGECRCGNSTVLTTMPTGTFPMTAADCAMPCAGNTATNCGGWGYYDFYGLPASPPALNPPFTPTNNPPVTIGCWTEGVGVRALSGGFLWRAAMTVELCGNFCLFSNFDTFGVEYGTECYCGPALDPSSTLAPSTDCNMPCPGNTAEMCGAGNRLNVYEW